MKKALFLGFICCIAACQPAIDFEEGDVRGNPQFYFTAELDGVPMQLQAGTNNFYLQTGVEQDLNQVYETSAALQPTNCSGCPNSWEFIIRDHAALDLQAAMLPDSTFQRKAYPFYRSYGTNLFRVQLQNQSFPGLNNQLVSSEWEVRNNTGQLIESTQATAPQLLLPQGSYRVRLTSFFTNGCNNTLEKNIQAAPLNTACSADFHYSLSANNSQIQMYAMGISLPPPYTVEWQINDQTFTGMQLSLSTDSLGTGGVNLVRMRVFNASCTTEVVKQVTNDPITRCTVNFRVSSSAFNAPIQTGTLRIQYRRADGTLFCSSFGDQQSSANFVITDITEFKNSPQGLPVKQLKGTVRCTLFSADGSEQLNINNGAFNLAFPYKH
jgi:hypothetical protein